MKTHAFSGIDYHMRYPGAFQSVPFAAQEEGLGASEVPSLSCSQPASEDYCRFSIEEDSPIGPFGSGLERDALLNEIHIIYIEGDKLSPSYTCLSKHGYNVSISNIYSCID